MHFPARARAVLLFSLVALAAVPAVAQEAAQAAAARRAGATVRLTGVVRDEANAISLPGIPVEVVDTKEVVYTDVDGRYVLNLSPGPHQIRVAMEGYQEKRIDVTAGDERSVVLNVGLTMQSFAETVTVTAEAVSLATSSAEAQLVERKQAPVITDNVGAQEMKQNGDSDAASAMSRVTGLSLVDWSWP